MTATQKRRKSTAFHEAGYAVIARVLTLPAGSASIKPDYDEGAWANASSSLIRLDRRSMSWRFCSTVWKGGSGFEGVVRRTMTEL